MGSLSPIDQSRRDRRFVEGKVPLAGRSKKMILPVALHQKS
jgi:hypothetical protein